MGRRAGVVLVVVIAVGIALSLARGQGQQPPSAPDTVQDAQTPREAPAARPEQRKSDHDRSTVFSEPAPSSPALGPQPDQGRETGFVFARDPHDAQRPLQTFEEALQKDRAAKPNISAAQRRLLEARYTLTPRLDPSARMSRGKPLPVGPTARLPQGISWEQLAALNPEDIRVQA